MRVLANLAPFYPDRPVLNFQNCTLTDDSANQCSTVTPFGSGSAVTQITSISTAVVLNSGSGVITTVSAATAAQAISQFTVTNSAVSAASVVVLSLGAYSGTFGTNGTPLVSVSTVAAGSFQVTIYNAHAANALSGTLKINFVVA